MPNYTLGQDGKGYYHATSLFDDSNGVAELLSAMTEADVIQSLTIALNKGEADITTRGSGGWRETVGTLKEGEVSGTMKYDTSDPFFREIRDAWLNNTELACVFLDGDKSGNVEGFGANFNVFDFTKSEELESAMTVDFNLKPSSYAEWYNSDGS